MWVTLMKIEYEVYQLPLSSPNKFMNYDWCKHQVVIRDYVLVYIGTIEESDNVLEDIFERLNVDWPEDYHAASLSVSDIVVLKKDGLRTWYYVNGIGFKKLREIKL